MRITAVELFISLHCRHTATTVNCDIFTRAWCWTGRVSSNENTKHYWNVL